MALYTAPTPHPGALGPSNLDRETERRRGKREIEKLKGGEVKRWKKKKGRGKICELKD